MKSMVSTKNCGFMSPGSPFSHGISTSFLVSGSACLRLEPSPAACSCFISVPIDALKSADSGSLKKSGDGLPFVRRSLIVVECVGRKTATIFLPDLHDKTGHPVL